MFRRSKKDFFLFVEKFKEENFFLISLIGNEIFVNVL